MNTLPIRIVRCTIAATIGMAPALAPAQGAAGAGQAAAASTAPTSAAEMTEAEVRRVDVPGAKLTLRHGEIRNLDMPPMTMVFNVRDKTLLDTLKAGDKVRFRAINDAGKYTVTELEIVR
jgi:Cu/Ag efflux protein CusF